MRQLALITAVAASFVAIATAHAQVAPDGPELVADRFARAWTAHDIAGFASIAARDVSWVTAAGVKVEGRQAMLDVLTREHATWARTTRMSVMGTSVRRIDDKHAVVFLTWEIAGRIDERGNTTPPSHGVNLFVVARDSVGWSIAAGQVTRTATPESR